MEKQRYIYSLLILILFATHLFGYALVRSKEKLQIVSDVYKKQPYISVPTARIEASLRFKILQQINIAIAPKWQAWEVTLKSDWAKKLKFRPAINIALQQEKKPSKPNLKPLRILLIYPKNYRRLIEDPLAEDVLPILYVGSTRRVAFYFYPARKIPIIQKIIRKLRLNE